MKADPTMVDATRVQLEQLWPAADSQVSGTLEQGAQRAILRAAIEMFGRNGYGGTSTRSIAAAASVTAPLIGYHFGSKEGLFRECVDLVVGGFTQRALAVCEQDQPLEAMVRCFASLHVHAAHAHPAALRFALSIAYGPEEGQPEIDLFAYWLPLTSVITQRLQRAIDEGEFRPRDGATLPGLVQHFIHSVHFEVFAAYERERFGKLAPSVLEHTPAHADPVGEVVAQFFHGAGTLAVRPDRAQEDH